MAVYAILLWLACVAGGTGFAASRNMPFSGFLTCLLLGPIGLIVVLLSDSRAKCPACLGRLPVGKPTICRHCRTSLVWESRGVRLRVEGGDRRLLDPVPEYYYPPFASAKAPYDPSPEDLVPPP